MSQSLTLSVAKKIVSNIKGNQRSIITEVYIINEDYKGGEAKEFVLR